MTFILSVSTKTLTFVLIIEKQIVKQTKNTEL